MSGLARRLARMEAAVRSRPARRCDRCRAWPPCRTVYVNDWRARLNLDTDATEVPEQCDGCGYAPPTVVVEYVDDWRAVR